MKFTSTISKEAIKNFYDSKTGGKIKNHKNFEDAKKIGVATIHAGAAFYDGLIFFKKFL